MFLSCNFAVGANKVNFGGGGGGMFLGGGWGIPLSMGWTNLLGGGIFDTFLTSKLADSSLRFDISDPCNKLETKKPSLIFQ